MDAETWGTMPEDLENFRVEISNNLPSLEELCLSKVADTLDFHCPAPKQEPTRKQPVRTCKRSRLDSATVDPPQPHVDPFKYLTPVLLNSLQRILEEKDLASTPRVLPHLIGANSQRLTADLSYDADWTRKDREALLKTIRQRGQNLCHLSLSLGWDHYVNQVLLKSMLGVLTKLTYLKLDGLDCGDSTLATIGSSCPELRSLSVRSYETGEGLRYLYDSDLPRGANGEVYGRCKKLTHLDVDGCLYLKVVDMVDVLLNLPELIFLKSDSWLYSAVAKYAESHKGRQLKLQNVTFDEIFKEKMPNLVCVVPDVRKLNFAHEDLKDVDEILKLKHVTYIKMYHVQSPNPTLLITNFSQQLTKLKFISCDYNIDISIVGFHCHQLEELTWGLICTTESKHKLVPSIHFNKLKKVKVNYLGRTDYIFPIDAWKCILASPFLEQFKSRIYFVSDDPDGALSWLLEEARSHGVVLSILREFALPDNISSLRVKQILCLSPKLKLLQVPHEAMLENVEEFMRQHDLDHCQVKCDVF